MTHPPDLSQKDMSETEFDYENALWARAAIAAKSAAWVWEVETGHASWTKSMHDVFDIRSDSFDGKPESLLELFHPDDRDNVRRGMESVMHLPTPFAGMARALHSSDSHWIRAQFETHQRSQGRRLIGTFVNADPLRRLESSLQESEQRFRRLLDTSPVSITISTLETGELVEVNTTVLADTGYTREEALGRTTVDLGIWPRGADRDEVIAALREPGGVRHRIVHLRTRDGTERIGALTAERIMFRGAPHMLTLVEDITVREKTQAALRESEQRLRLALRAANAGVWQMNLSANELFWSDEFRDLYGYNAETPPGRESWAAHLHPDDRERMLDDLRNRLRPGTDEYSREFRILHPTRGLRWILALGQITRSPEGRALSMTGISIDITRSKEVERELRDADERKNEFLAVLSHELRNPLAPLRNGLEILRLAKDDSAVAERTRAMMTRQLDQMVHLVDDLLEVSRISRGKIELKRTPMNLALAIQHAIEVSKPLIEAAGHELQIEIPEAPLIVDGDLTRLTQVFGNLLNNAAKFTHPGGKIHVSVRDNDGCVVVAVKDSGIGIPPELLPKVFEMFAQLDTSLHRTQGGLGIGLSLAKRLVEKHGGALEAHSEGAGKGSTFTVRLPLHETGTSSPGASSPAMATVSPRALRILIADDNEDAATSLALVLEMKGHRVRTVSDGSAAILEASLFSPDIVILDIGAQARRLRRLPQTARPTARQRHAHRCTDRLGTAGRQNKVRRSRLRPSSGKAGEYRHDRVADRAMDSDSPMND
jgi:PAS domain S-box-containing protein